jgi:hypothetical protein
MASWLETVTEDFDLGGYEMEPVYDPDTGEVLYYKPTGKQAPAAPVGTPEEKEEIPIPHVSLPDVVKPEIKPQTTYEVMPPHIVPEAPAEQLEKLLPPVDKNAELEALNLPPVDVYEKVAERVRRRAPARPPEEEPPPPPDERGLIEKATAPERFGAAKFLEHPGNLVYGIPAALAELLAGIEEMTPTENVPKSARQAGEATRQTVPKTETFKPIASWLKEAQAQSKRGVAKVTGTEGQKPVTGLEKLGSYLGEYSQPTKGVSAAATIGLAATGAAARGGLTTFGPEDVPIVSQAQAQGFDPSKAFGPPAGGFDTKPKGPPAKVAPAKGAPVAPTPMAPGSQIVPAGPPPMPLVPTGRITGDTKIDKKTGEIKPEKEKKVGKYDVEPAAPEGMILPPPDQWTTTPPTLKQRQGRLLKNGTRVGAETDEQFKQRLFNAHKYKEIAARTYSPSATKTFQAVNGMEHMSETDYRAATFAGATLVGMLLTGLGLKLLRRGNLPQPKSVADAVRRDVENAAPGTTAISTRTDVLRTADDVNAAATRIAGRAGLLPSVVERLQNLFRIQTRNGARALADSAIVDGRAYTPSFTFQAPVSLAEISRRATPLTDQYLKTRAIVDELLAKSSVGAMKPGSQSVTVQGMTIADALKMVGDLEKKDPQLLNIAKAHQSWNKALRDYQVRGEYATISKQKHNELSMSHTNQLGPKASEEGAFVAAADRARRLFKQRLDNEAIGTYIDEVRKVDPTLFTKISLQDLRNNPQWKANTVSFLRKGVREFYTTDQLLAQTLKSDYHMITGWGGNPLYATKKLLESTTTGNLAPNFGVTSAIRSYWIAKFTTEQGFKSPSAFGTVMAVPQQLLPQIAKSVSHGLDSGSGQILNQVMGPGWSQGLSRRLADYYTNSVYAQLKQAGAHRGSLIEQQRTASQIANANQIWNAAAAESNLVRGTQHVWNAWKAMIESAHAAPGYAFFRKNIGREGPAELALRTRRLTGDPRTAGSYLDNKGRPFQISPHENEGALNRAIRDKLVQGYGFSADLASQAVPWWNPTMQGIKRIGEAYLHDPIRFTRSTALYAMAPAATMFYFAKWLDKDPNGKSYIDYLLNGRSAYNRQMNFYIPIPGRPVEDGIELTFFHELNPFKRAIEIGLHHMLGENTVEHESPLSMFLNMPDNVVARRTLKEDMWTALHMFLDTAVIPPMPPLANFALGAFGIRGPQGMFGGEAFPVKSDPYNQNGGLPNSIELMSRALIGGVGESFGQFYAASTQSPDAWNGLVNGLAQVRDVNIRKTPLLRDALNYGDMSGALPDRSNNTDLAKNVFEHQKTFNELARYYKKWTVNEGKINIKPASVGGGPAVREQYGLTQLGPANIGLPQPEPNNPLYLKFMEQFYNKFMHESPNMVKGEDKGGVGFKSLWRNYGTATQKLDRLKDVNHGTYDRWQANLNNLSEEDRAELTSEGVDIRDRREVVNFYRTKQYDALRVIDYVRRATEMEMSEQATAEARQLNPNAPPVNIRLKDIKPFLGATENMIEGVSNWLNPAPFMYGE